MKNLRIIYLLTGILAFAFLGCKKEYEEHYRITNYAQIEMAGDKLVILSKGSTYSDQGATAKSGTENVTVNKSGTVDTNTPGVYIVKYTAVNKDGFAATDNRFVVVYSTDASAEANDFSGSYARSTNGVLAVWTKLAPGVYQVVNPGGAPGATLTVIVFNPTGNTIFIPEQVSSDGSLTSSSNETYTVGSPSVYSWKIVNPGYGTALRTFTKK